MKKIISIFITIAIVFQLTNVLAASSWSLHEIPDISNADLIGIGYKYVYEGQSYQYTSTSLPDDVYLKIRDTVKNFRYDNAEPPKSIDDFDSERDNSDFCIFISFLISSDNHSRMRVNILKDKVVFRYVPPDYSNEAIHMYSTYENENLFEKIENLIEPLASEARTASVPEKTEKPEKTESPEKTEEPEDPIKKYEEYLSQFPKVRKFEKIYRGQMRKASWSAATLPEEWGICKLEMESGDILYKAYIEFYEEDDNRNTTFYALTSNIDNNKMVFSTNEMFDSGYYVGDKKELNRPIAEIKINVNENYEVTYLETNHCALGVVDMAKYKSEGSLKDIPGFEFKTGTIYTPPEKPTATPTAKPTAAPTVRPTTAPTAKPTTAPTVQPEKTASPVNEKYIENFSMEDAEQIVKGDFINVSYCGRIAQGNYSGGVKKSADEVYKFMKGLFAFFIDAPDMSEEEIKKITEIQRPSEEYDPYFMLRLDRKRSDDVKSKLYIQVQKDYAYISGTILGTEKKLKIKDKHAFDKYLYENYKYIGIEIEEEERSELWKPADRINRAGLKKQEQITFNVKTDDTFYYSIIEEISDPGTELKCTLENWWNGSVSYILKLEGNKGSKMLYMDEKRDLYKPGIYRGLAFCDQSYIDNNLWYRMNINKYKNYIFIDGNGDNVGIDGITFQLKYGLEGTSRPVISTILSGYDVKYECYNARVVEYQRSLINLFCLPTREEFMKNYYSQKFMVRELKRKRTDDGEEYDSYVDFVAEAPIALSKIRTWANVLGDNTKVSLVGICRTKNGKEESRFPMLRFTGTDGEVWFDISDEETKISGSTQYDKAFYAYRVDSTDDFTMVCDSYQNDCFAVVFKFDENDVLLGIRIVDSDKASAIFAKSIEEMDCKGGTNSYGKWF